MMFIIFLPSSFSHSYVIFYAGPFFSSIFLFCIKLYYFFFSSLSYCVHPYFLLLYMFSSFSDLQESLNQNFLLVISHREAQRDYSLNFPGSRTIQEV